jgi:hypothetical protein
LQGLYHAAVPTAQQPVVCRVDAHGAQPSLVGSSEDMESSRLRPLAIPHIEPPVAVSCDETDGARGCSIREFESVYIIWRAPFLSIIMDGRQAAQSPSWARYTLSCVVDRLRYVLILSSAALSMGIESSYSILRCYFIPSECDHCFIHGSALIRAPLSSA